MKGRLTNCLRQYRQEAEMTQQGLAEDVGVTRQTIIAIEKGDYIPSVLLALQVSHSLNKSVEEVFECV